MIVQLIIQQCYLTLHKPFLIKPLCFENITFNNIVIQFWPNVCSLLFKSYSSY